MASQKKRALLSLVAACFVINVGYIWYFTAVPFKILLRNETFGSILYLGAHEENSTSSWFLAHSLHVSGTGTSSDSVQAYPRSELPHSKSEESMKSKFDEVFQNFSLSYKDLRLGRQLPSNNDNVIFKKIIYTRDTTPAVTLVSATDSNPITEKAALQPDYPNPHPYNFIINESQVCSRNKSEVYTVIVVCSALTNFKERTAIRNTWGSPTHLERLKSKLVFLFGATTDEQLQSRVLNESRHFRDIIQEDFLDTYKNLSLKSVALLKWVTANCLSAKFVLKTDDDMFINTEMLYKTLLQTKPVWSILGVIIVGARPVQDKKSKWYTPTEDFPQRVYPKYCSGTAYVISTDLVPSLYNVTLYTPLFWLEDIYITGICGGKLQPRYLAGKGFSLSERPTTGCAYKDAISGHRVPAKSMYKIWEELNDLETLNKKCPTRDKKKTIPKRRFI